MKSKYFLMIGVTILCLIFIAYRYLNSGSERPSEVLFEGTGNRLIDLILDDNYDLKSVEIYVKTNPHQINQPDFFGFYPIHRGILKQDKNLVVLLTSNGADINQKADAHGSFGGGYTFEVSPLHVVMKLNKPDLDFISFMIDNGADPHQTDAEGKSASDYAKEYKNYDVVDLLNQLHSTPSENSTVEE